MRRAFTLVEILAVITILGLLFTTLLFTFYEIYNSSLRQKEEALKIQEELKLFWMLSRAFYGAKKFVLRNGTKLYFITTGSNTYRGFVKAVYTFENGTLYYCEFPYPYGSIYNCTQKFPMFKLQSFKAFAVTSKGEEKDYFRKPNLLRLNINNDTFYLKNF